MESIKERATELLKSRWHYIAIVCLLVLCVCLFMAQNNERQRIRQELERRHADEMAQCLTDYHKGENGGCYYEEIEAYFEGDFVLVDLEITARPKEQF